MIKATNYEGLKVQNQEYDIEDTVASRWISKGIAEPIVVEIEDDIDEEATKKEVGSSTGDSKPSAYKDMKVKDLYKACKDRDLEVEAKKPAKYYIDLLVLDDIAKIDDPDQVDEE